MFFRSHWGGGRQFDIFQLALWRRLATSHGRMCRFPHLRIHRLRWRRLTMRSLFPAGVILVFVFRQLGGLHCLMTDILRFRFKWTVANHSRPGRRHRKKQNKQSGDGCPPAGSGNDASRLFGCLSHLHFLCDPLRKAKLHLRKRLSPASTYFTCLSNCKWHSRSSSASR